jgi:TRAP-type mannitol/chloroaromatic compound transport system permease small subunit
MLALADALDALSRRIGMAVRWLALGMVLLQFGIVLLRYVFGISTMFLNESVLYLHGAVFMLGAGFTLLVDQHVRVDIFYARRGSRGRAITDIFGALVFLAPAVGLMLWWTWPSVTRSWAILEGPISVGGVPASFLLKSLIPAFCVLLLVQALSILIRDVIRLKGRDA